RVVELTNDPDAQVCLQAAYSLGAWGDPRAGEALGRMAVKHSDDAYLIAAVLSSLNEKNLSDVLTTVLKESGERGPPPSLVTQLMRVAIATKTQKAQEELLSAATTSRGGKYAQWQFEAVAGNLDRPVQISPELSKRIIET